MKILALFAVFLLSLLPARAQLTVQYLRHAEGGHNVVDEYNRKGIPREQWPSWVGKSDQFTPLGEKQARAVPAILAGRTFDLIAVSPLWRTRHTILLYLQQTGQTAELWPELTETVGFPLPQTAGEVSTNLWAGVRRLAVPADEAPYFRLRTDGVGARELSATNRVQAIALAVRVEELLRERFGTNRATVLLVGHGNAGKTLLRELVNQPDLHLDHPKNIGIWVAVQESDEAFRLTTYNDAPFPGR